MDKLTVSISYVILGVLCYLCDGCPEFCHCTTPTMIDCSKQNLTGVPKGIHRHTTHLDLSVNNISSLPDFAFQAFPDLQELRLAGNTISTLPGNVFYGLNHLQYLSMEGNRFRVVPKHAFQRLFSLQEIYLDANLIEDIPPDSFEGTATLKFIRLGKNKLEHIPVAALRHLKNLQALSLSVNKIKKIEDFTFQNNTNLNALTLDENKISSIGDHAFEGLQQLTILQLQRNSLRHIPPAMISLTSLQELDLAGNKIDFIPDRSFQKNKNLKLISLKGNAVKSVGQNAFRELPLLKELKLSEVYDMTYFPNLTGSRAIETLRLDRASIRHIPSNICQILPNLKNLDMHSNKVTVIPSLGGCQALRQINLGNNLIASLEGGIFSNLSMLQDLILSHNNIQALTEDTFKGLRHLEYLDLAFNSIEYIHELAFSTVTSLQDLNLSENKFPTLPTKGLQNLKMLKTFHNNALQDPIGPKELPNVKTLVLSYAYHCCNFLNIAEPEEKLDRPMIVGPGITFGRNTSQQWIPNPSFKTSNESSLIQPDQYYKYSNHEYQFADNLEHPKSNEHLDDNSAPFGASILNYPDTVSRRRTSVTCDPKPGPFLPCDDLFGWWSLRCGVWIVFLLAVLGNAIVLFVSITARHKLSMDVPRFLVCNLACADLFMGIYLGMLAIVDASSLGSFQRYAIKWQTSTGCLVAGFLGVISSELSVFTLTVITVERVYAISNALHFNKRLSLKQAGIIMSIGWAFCILNASLPFFGISDYRKFAICLPFETSDRASLAYVCFLMLFNAVSFVVIVISYIKIYCSIMGSNAWNSKDFRIAKRMSILVFTDFLCWSPIIFFSVTAAFGVHLVGLNEAKVLTIFVLPLNSCANPFLYAIFTKQFKRDCVKLCKRIEESSISRSLSNINSRRVSFGSSWRHSQLHNPFHMEKRSSISNSVSGGSSVHGMTNQNGENVDSAGKKDVNYFFGTEVDCTLDKTTKHKVKLVQGDAEPYTEQNELSVGATGSDTQIVIHFDDKEKNMLAMHSCEDEDSEHCRKCRTKRDRKVERKESERTETTNVSDNCTVRLRSKNGDQTEKECPVKDKSYNENYKRRKLKRNCDNAHGFNRLPHVSSAPHVQIPTKEVLKLPVSHDASDKTSHINEWRKSSHLTYLWRNSLEVEGNMPTYKSNSIAELTRQVKDYDNSPCKRRSLSSRHEGYILLKNNNRDSAYEDEEEMLEYNNCKALSVEQCKHYKSTKQISDTTDASEGHQCSRRQSECDSKDAMTDERHSLLMTSSLCSRSPTPRKENCDKESGFSSET